MSESGFARIVTDPDLPRTKVRVFSSADRCEIVDLAVPAATVASCERCGETLAAGDWPFCPHGRSNYSFKMGR